MVRLACEHADTSQRVAVYTDVISKDACSRAVSRACSWPLADALCIAIVWKMKSRLFSRFAVCVVITSGIAAWPSVCDARLRVADHNGHPFRHSLHLFRRGVSLPSLHSSYPCSVLGHRPCIPYGTYCSVFSHRPCLPDIDYPIGETLQLTIVSRGDKSDASEQLPHDLNTIREVFSALRTCWVPPEKEVARSGTQITLRLSFNSHGGMISEPRITYLTADTPSDVREVYWNAANAAVKRCTPLQFTGGLGGAIAGRPFAIRFVDDRSF
jgi:hypothetical protein